MEEVLERPSSATAEAFAVLQCEIAALEDRFYVTACTEFPIGRRVRWFIRNAKNGTRCFSEGVVVRHSRTGLFIRLLNGNIVKKAPQFLERVYGPSAQTSL